jgi:hypothetical protein
MNAGGRVGWARGGRREVPRRSRAGLLLFHGAFWKHWVVHMKLNERFHGACSHTLSQSPSKLWLYDVLFVVRSLGVHKCFCWHSLRTEFVRTEYIIAKRHLFKPFSNWHLAKYIFLCFPRCLQNHIIVCNLRCIRTRTTGNKWLFLSRYRINSFIQHLYQHRPL